MINRPWSTLIALSGAFIIAGAASAADKEPQKPGEAMFEKMDTNHDGVITHDELMAHVKAKFDEFDKNKDGYLVLDELPKEMPMPAHMKHAMERMKKWEKRRGDDDDQRPGMDADDRGPEGRGPEGMGPRKAPTRMQFMAKFDRDGDERVSLEEFAEPAIRHFKHADLNGDGKVTKDEAQEAVKHRFREMREHPPMRR